MGSYLLVSSARVWNPICSSHLFGKVFMLDVILKRFENADEVREFPKGKFETIEINGMVIGRASYQPGWKWSVDVGTASNQTLCQVEHVGMVISGCATAAMADGTVIE